MTQTVNILHSQGVNIPPKFLYVKNSCSILEYTKSIYYILYTIYYILYTIYCILYTIYYILYTIYYILFTSYCLHHFLSKYTQIWAILRKSWGCSSSVQDVVDTFFQMKMVQDLPETISSSKTKRFKSYEIFTHWPPANTVTNLPQIGFFSKSGFSR